MALKFELIKDLKYVKQQFRLPYDPKKQTDNYLIAMIIKNTAQSLSIISNPLVQRGSNYLRYYKPMVYTDKIFTKTIRERMDNSELKELTQFARSEKLSFFNKANTIKNKNVFVDTSPVHSHFIDNCKGRSYMNICTSYIDHLVYYMTKTCAGLNHEHRFFAINVADWGISASNRAANLSTNHKMLNPISILYYLMKKDPEKLSALKDYTFIFLDGTSGWFKWDMDEIDDKSIAEFYRLFGKFRNQEINLDDSPESDEDAQKKAAALASIKKEKEDELSDDAVEDVPESDDNDEDEETTAEYDENGRKKVANDELENDLEYSEDDLEIARKAIEDNHDDLSRTFAGNKRMQLLREKQKSIKVGNVSMKDLDEENAADYHIDEVDISDKIFTPVKSAKKVRYDNMNKSYNEKCRTKDLMNVFKSLNDKKDMPAVVKSIKVEDSSTAMDLKETWHVILETPDHIQHSITVDIPKPYDENYFYLGGNRKQFVNQQILKPLVKISPDTVQVCTNYNKIFVYRYGDILSPRVTLFRKIILNNPKIFSVRRGNGSSLNNGHMTTIEYDSLAFDFVGIEIRGSNSGLVLDQEFFDKLRKDGKCPAIDDNKYLYCIVDAHKDKNKPVFIPVSTDKDNTEEYSVITYFVTLYKEITGNDFWALAGPKDKPGKRFMYTSCTLMAKKVPMVLLLSYFEGLSTVLHKAGIQYRFVESRERIDISAGDRRVDFSNGFLIYDSSNVAAGLLLSGLSLFDTKAYKFEEMDNPNTYLDIFDAMYDNRRLASAFDAYYDNLIDPITKEILIKMDLPSDPVGLLLAANFLLSDNAYQSEISLTEFRVRNMEMVSVYLYKAISNAYSTYKRKSMEKNPEKISVPKNAVIKELLMSNIMEDVNILNPIAEQEKLHAITRKGPNGINLDRSYTKDKRCFDKSMAGCMTISTSPDALCGVVRTLTVEPKVTNTRGFIDCEKKNSDMNASELFGYGEMITPLGITNDDSIRSSMAVKQMKHLVSVKDMCPSLLTTGTDKRLPYVATKDYVIRAKDKGKVIDYDEKSKMVIVEYADKSHEAINLNPVISKNGGGGFYLSHSMKCLVKKGQTFKKNEILAHNDEFFSNHYDGTSYNLGTLCKCAIMSSYATFEDAKMVTEGLSQRMASDFVMQKHIVLGSNANVSQMVKVGDQVKAGDSLITFEQSNEEAAVNKLLRDIGKEMQEDIRAMGRNTVKTKYTGVIEDIRIYSTEELSDLSPSLKKIVAEYWTKIANKKKLIKKYNITDPTYQGNTFFEISTPIRPDATGKVKGYKIDEGVIIEFYIKYRDYLKPGDKLCDEYALKGVTCLVIPEGQEPYTPDFPDEPIETCLPASSVLARITPQIIKTMFIQKLLVNLRKQLKAMFEGSKFSHKTRVQMEKYIYDVFTTMDPTKLNTNFYSSFFSKMSDKEFQNFFTGLFKDPNGYLYMHVEMFENDPDINNVEKCAKLMNVPLYEYVVQPYFSSDKEHPMVTPYPVPVGYIMEKRVQQTAIKKNSASVSVTQRDAKTNQVVGVDKNGQQSIDENYAMMTYGAKVAVKEFMSFRSDDARAKEEAYSQIRNQGYVSMRSLPDDIGNKTSLNLLDAYMISMGIKTDLVTDGYTLRKTTK